MEKSNSPRIRFKGFTELWEQRKLWELTIWDKKFNEVESLKQPKTIKYPYVLADSLNNLEEPNGDVLLLSTGTYIGYTTKEKAGSNLCYGEIVAIPWGGVANIKYCSGFFVTADNRIATSSDKDRLDNKYLYWWMESNLVSIQNTYRGASIKDPSMNDVLSLKISFPSIEEQKVISNYLDQVDTLITLHQRKCDRLKKVKQGLLEKMFPTEKEDTPKIRFKGFTEPWEQRKYEQIFDYERPDKYMVENVKYVDDAPTPVLTANKAFVLGYTEETNTYKNPCIIFDDFTLDNKLVNFDFMVKSSAMKILTVKPDYDLNFSYSRLQSTKIEVLGHARHYISVVQNTSVYCPNFNEQKFIGALFNKLDSLITLHQRKLSLTKGR